MCKQTTGSSNQATGKLVPRLVLTALVIFLFACCCGCFTKTVYVPAGKSVRLRADVKAKVWALDADGNSVPGKMTLKEGWYVVPDPGEEK